MSYWVYFPIIYIYENNWRIKLFPTLPPSVLKDPIMRRSMVPHGEDALKKKIIASRKIPFLQLFLGSLYFFIRLCITFYLLNLRNYHLNLDCIIFFAFTRWENHKIYGGLIKKFQFAKYQSLKENVHLGWMNHRQISTSSLWKKPSYYRLNRFFLQTHRTKNSHNKVNWLKKDFFVMIQFQFSDKLELYFINPINGNRQKNGRL